MSAVRLRGGARVGASSAWHRATDREVPNPDKFFGPNGRGDWQLALVTGETAHATAGPIPNPDRFLDRGGH